MDTIRKIFCSLACWAALCASMPANAVVITLTDTVVANPDIAITQTPVASYTFIHDFTDNGFVAGDQFTSATINIRLTDLNSNEDSLITVGLGQTGTGGNVSNNTVNDPSPAGTFVSFPLNATARLDLGADGKLSVTVSSTNGDFFFADSTITAQVNRTASVPEPLPLALIGLGFVGLSAARRGKSKE